MTLPFELGLAGWLWLGAAAFAAAWVRGYSGFGFAAILIAAGGLVVHPLRLVAVAILADLLLSAQMWRGLRHDIDWPRAALLFVGALVGLPLGLWALGGLSETAVRLVVAVYVLAMGLVLLRGWVLRAQGPAVPLATGVVSGAANAAGVGGLPVVAMMAAQPIPAARFRATLVAYFVLLDLWTLPMLALHGLVVPETGWALLLLAPVLFAGTWAGSRRFGRAQPADFRRFAIRALIALALLGILRALV